jgi:hypothetical protein
MFDSIGRLSEVQGVYANSLLVTLLMRNRLREGGHATQSTCVSGGTKHSPSRLTFGNISVRGLFTRLECLVTYLLMGSSGLCRLKPLARAV